MRRKPMVFALLYFSLSCADAAEVLWNLFSSCDNLLHEPGIQLYYYGHGSGIDNIQLEIGVLYEYAAGTFTSINGLGPSNVGMNGTIWIDALYGDVLVDNYFATYFASGDRLYVENGFFDPYWTPSTTYSRGVASGETIYIAFAGESLREHGDIVPYYGWLELLVKDDELSLVSSALTYSPRLIVGTGDFAAIPEPSAGMLLLLGLAALALLRR